ncbi:transposase [Pasteuria penetrans]|uniref:transposase n=1 Tax=Pasteuria penetrans TaxID=86005 RepID=UPI000F920893|nr:transposase [Pasteuria penetrans]
MQLWGIPCTEAVRVVVLKIQRIPSQYNLPLTSAYAWLKTEGYQDVLDGITMPKDQSIEETEKTTVSIFLDPDHVKNLKDAVAIREFNHNMPKPVLSPPAHGIPEVKVVGLVAAHLPEKYGPVGERVSLTILESRAKQPSPETKCAACGCCLVKTGYWVNKAGFQDKPRIIKHGIINDWVCLSIMRTQRWECPLCGKDVTHVYSIIEPKNTYTKACKKSVADMASVSTAKASAGYHGIPEKTAYGMLFEGALPKQGQELEAEALKRYKNREVSPEKMQEILHWIIETWNKNIVKSTDLDKIDSSDELPLFGRTPAVRTNSRCSDELPLMDPSQKNTIMYDGEGRGVVLSPQELKRLRALCTYGIVCIDDTAVRKGNEYVTLFHDPIHKTVLAVIKGRSQEELEKNIKEFHPELLELKPAAVIIDRARSYRNFIEKNYCDAVIIHDRFHIVMNIRDHALHPMVTGFFKNKKFVDSVDQMLLDLLQKSLYKQLTPQDELALQELLKYFPDLKLQYEKIEKTRSRFRKQYEQSKLSRDDVDECISYIIDMYENLISEYKNMPKNKKKNCFLKIKQAIRGALKNRYWETMDSQVRAFIKRVFEYTSSWSHLEKAYGFVTALGHWYDNEFHTIQEARDALRALIEAGLQSRCVGIQNAAKSLESGEDYIANYHLCRMTNGVAEGRNCFVKSIMRRYFGIKNDKNYKNLVIVLSNRPRTQTEYKPRYSRVRSWAS